MELGLWSTEASPTPAGCAACKSDFECILVLHCTGFETVNVQRCKANHNFYDIKITRIASCDSMLILLKS